MAGSLPTPPEQLHDETLVDWFLSLEPVERLAELESRLAFFAGAQRHVESKLPDKKALGRDKDQAALRLLEMVLRKRSERG
jgi:hypothetical protein